MTALVHFLNNIFKLILLGKHAKKRIVFEFGIPAIITAFLGAFTLIWLTERGALFEYQLFDKAFQILPVKLVIAALMIFFAFTEFNFLKKGKLERFFLPIGGLLSGFFGGLSGHQGALRSTFLMKYNLSKEQFIGTGVVIACLVDVCRLTVYGGYFSKLDLGTNLGMVITAVISAFIGAFLARKFLHKITFEAVKKLVTVMLVAIALGLASGII